MFPKTCIEQLPHNVTFVALVWYTYPYVQRMWVKRSQLLVNEESPYGMVWIPTVVYTVEMGVFVTGGWWNLHWGGRARGNGWSGIDGTVSNTWFPCVWCHSICSVLAIIMSRPALSSLHRIYITIYPHIKCMRDKISQFIVHEESPWHNINYYCGVDSGNLFLYYNVWGNSLNRKQTF